MKQPPVRLELLETHPFSGSADDGEFCRFCSKTRALHLHDGFVPNHQWPRCSMDPAVRYNSHTNWYRPGWLKNQKERNRDLAAIQARPERPPRSGVTSQPASRLITGGRVTVQQVRPL